MKVESEATAALRKLIDDSAHQWQEMNVNTPRPIASVYASSEGLALNISLDTERDESYAESIPGEGGDISLSRSFETKKLTGARLPLYAKTLMVGGSNLPHVRLDLESGEVLIDRDGEWQTLVPAVGVGEKR